MKEYDFYLAGPICHDENGNDWRERLIRELPQIRFFNPLEDGVEGEIGDYREPLNALRARAENGDLLALDELRRVMRELIIPSDLSGISRCKRGLICYVKAGKRAWGSICEIYEAKVKQKKSVFLVSELPYTKMNNWEIGLSDTVFHSLDSLINSARAW